MACVLATQDEHLGVTVDGVGRQSAVQWLQVRRAR
jgi:hypothetical protein